MQIDEITLLEWVLIVDWRTRRNISSANVPVG